MCAGMDAAGLDAFAVFYPARIAYLTGFHHIPTERPIVLILGPNEYSALVVPAVEKEHAESVPGIDRVGVYFEYPGAEHPMELVATKLAEINAKPRRTGSDNDGYAPYWGYRGPRLSDLTGERPVDAEMLVESLRRVKSTTEIACIQLSCDWAARAHHRMQDARQDGDGVLRPRGHADPFRDGGGDARLAPARVQRHWHGGDVRRRALNRDAAWIRHGPRHPARRRSGQRRGR